MNKRTLIITGVGLAIGFAEALIYYNIGKKKKQGETLVQLPKGKELAQTLSAVLITAVLTGILSNQIEKMLPEAPQPLAV